MRINNLEDIINNKKQLKVLTQIDNQVIQDSAEIIDYSKLFGNEANGGQQITLDNLDIHNKFKTNLQNQFFKGGKEANISEERDWKIGKVRKVAPNKWVKVSTNNTKESEGDIDYRYKVVLQDGKPKAVKEPLTKDQIKFYGQSSYAKDEKPLSIELKLDNEQKHIYNTVFNNINTIRPYDVFWKESEGLEKMKKYWNSYIPKEANTENNIHNYIRLLNKLKESRSGYQNASSDIEKILAKKYLPKIDYLLKEGEKLKPLFEEFLTVIEKTKQTNKDLLSQIENKRLKTREKEESKLSQDEKEARMRGYGQNSHNWTGD